MSKKTWPVIIDEDGWKLEPGLDDTLAGGLTIPDVYSTEATQKYPLGARLTDVTTGRVFRYAKMGAVAGVVGKLYQGALPIADHLNIAVLAAAIGVKLIKPTPGATAGAADLYKDGLVHINVSTGLGHAYRIKDHLAISASTEFTLNLHDAIKVALAATSKVTLTHNRYKNILIHPSPPTAMLSGVPAVAIAASEFGWVQVRGLACCLIQGTVVIGDLCVPSATVDGAVMPSAAIETDGPQVGVVAKVNADTEYGLIDLQLE